VITILRSVGPVISTRRSSRSFGCARCATRLGDGGSLRREIGRLPASNSFCRRAPREQFLAPRLELAMQSCDESERRLLRIGADSCVYSGR